jgi:hypothetical protein
MIITTFFSDQSLPFRSLGVSSAVFSKRKLRLLLPFTPNFKQISSLETKTAFFPSPIPFLAVSSLRLAFLDHSYLGAIVAYDYRALSQIMFQDGSQAEHFSGARRAS